MYPEGIEPWWVFFIDPSPEKGGAGDHYVNERDLAARLSAR